MNYKNNLWPLFFFTLPFLTQSIPADMSLEEIQKIKAQVRGLVSETLTDIVSDPVFGHQLLKDSLYIFTHPLRKRDIINQLPCNLLHQHKGVTFFYSQICKSVFDKHSTRLASYLNINQVGLIEALDREEFATIDLPEVLSLFAPTKVQERKFGFLFEYQTLFCDWSLVIKLPVLYQEYNFYLSSDERAAIKAAQFLKPRVAEPVIEQSPKHLPREQSVNSFAREHLIADKFGIGDLHFTCYKLFREKKKTKIYAGFDITLPTARAFKKGVFGSHFDPYYATPNFDLHADLVDLYAENNNAQLQQNVLDFGIATLDRLATLLLENPLGNRLHPGIAPLVLFEMDYSSKCTLFGQFKADFLLPLSEHRFFCKPVDKAALDATAETEPETEEEARAQVTFLNTQLLQKLFPERYHATVFPGFIFQSDLSATFHAKHSEFQCGLQCWYQSKEKIWSINSSDETVRKLDKIAGKNKATYQHSIWFSLKFLRDQSQIIFTGSGTPLNKQIGKSLTFSFSYLWEF